MAGAAGQVAVKPDLQDPRQRALLQGFLEAFHAELTLKPEVLDEFGVVLHSPEPRPPVPNPEHRRLSAHLYIGEGTIRFGYPLALPLSLPDDRRDRTRIEIDS